MTENTKSTAVSFQEQIRITLNHFHDPQWLEENSPLAAPYLLGRALPDQPADTPYERGHSLQQFLIAAAATLWPGSLPADKEALENAVNEERRQQGNKGSMYYYFLLELRYFRHYFRPTAHPEVQNEIAIYNYLGVSRASFFNHLKAAQQALGYAFLNTIRPTFRLEQPPLLTGKLIGREALLQQCLTDLDAGKSVALSGMGGAGKTAVGTALAQRWANQPVFWFTIRPTFNDQLNCLLFSLGYFLHQQGASGLWRQLVANEGTVENFNLALAQIRGDLHALSALPLFCIDEIDMIHAEPDQLTPAHIQIQEFLDGLQSLAPLLLIGQQHTFASRAHYEVSLLTTTQLDAFLAEKNLDLTPRERQQLHTYTGGNPRLLHLCVSLYETGMSVKEIITAMPQTPALQAIWERLWQRIEADERHLLHQLAVFRSPAPGHVWSAEQPALQRLHQRHIVQQDKQGGLFILPVIRDLIYKNRQRFSIEKREQCHVRAAQVRAAFGEYTAAAYHYNQAREEVKALQVWFPHRHLEIQRGQAGTALAIFAELSARHLKKKERQALAVLRAELLQLAALPQDGLNTLQAVPWREESELRAQAHLLQGDFLNALGHPHKALKKYEEGLEVTTRLLNQLVRFRYQQSVVHFQQKQLDNAWQEALLAEYEVMHLKGMVNDERGDYEEAIHYYRQALALAQQVDYEAGAARTHRAMATTLGRQSKLDEALYHTQTAVRYFERVGDRFSQERLNSTLAATYFQAGLYTEAIAIAEPTVSFFEKAKYPFWTAVTASTLAEAYFHVGQLDKAQQYAYTVIQLEEYQTQPYALHTLGLIMQANQDLGEAEKYLLASQQLAQENNDKYMMAYASRALGEVQARLGKSEASQKSMAAAWQLFESLGLMAELESIEPIPGLVPINKSLN